MGHCARALLLLWLFALGPSVIAGQIDRIEIDSSWTGWGSATGHITITRTSGGYIANGGNVDARFVSELFEALNGPKVAAPSPSACGITDAWLSENYEQALKQVANDRLSDLSSKQVDLFRSHFTDHHSAQVAFGELFKHWHTDDYPTVSVKVESGGVTHGVLSKSQYPFMLPWSGVGYDCRVSRAIADLMPANFPNRARLLLGDQFRSELAEQVMQVIRRDWDFLATEHRIGPEAAPVFARYIPLASEISNLSSIDLDGDQSWNAKLRSSDLPPNLVIGVSLRYEKTPLRGVDTLLRRVPVYAGLVLSVPWLRQFLSGHSNTTLELRYVNGLSLSPTALENLIRDLRKHGKTVSADMVAKTAADCAFVEIDSPVGWSRAVVLPTREVLLWHFKGDSVLGFSGNDLDVWDYYGWHSTGTLISVGGAIEK